uniref:4Fe-4S single cluster domain protein n=1 Tax=virus sp. ctmTa7 TaxID=2828255 RepID=A0A8S5RBH7_9VIRU|nr:MAG TPA: 4Fe-4S single cluster domain protein [virus sp. ctmTa7]
MIGGCNYNCYYHYYSWCIIFHKDRQKIET